VSEWKDYGEGTEFRPPSRRFVGDGLGAYVVAVGPVLTPADPEWKSKPGSIQWNASTEAFNRNVGWTVAHWHWSVVYFGGIKGAGDEPTQDAAQKAAEDCLRASFGRKKSLIAKVFGKDNA
jgi:hypothetical protein